MICKLDTWMILNREYIYYFFLYDLRLLCFYWRNAMGGCLHQLESGMKKGP